MRIAVNGCFVYPGRVGGAEQMLYDILEGLRGHVRPGDEWTVYTREPLATGALDPLRERRLTGLPRLNRMGFEALRLPAIRGVDAWLNANYYTPPGQSGRVVTVIHDAQFAHFPENFSPLKRRWLTVAHAATMRLADTVVAISQFSADDLRRLHGDRAARKITVIPNAVSFTRLQGGTIPAEVDAERPSILCAAAAYTHKNIPTLLRAFALVAARSEAQLLLTGAGPEQLVGQGSTTDVAGLVDELGLGERVRFLGYVNAPTLGALYRHATVFALPSRFEGFGLPVVEALGSGTPVVTTRCASIPEVSLGLADYVEDPTDPDELAEHLLAVLADPDRFRPSEQDQLRLRATYAPAEIGRRYAQLLTA